MAYRPLRTFARNDQLGAPSLNQLLGNGEALEDLATTEHTPGGLHNALLVARAVAAVTVSAGAPVLAAGSSPGVTAVSGFTAGGTTGVCTLTLSSTYFGGLPIIARVAPRDSKSEQVPVIVTAEVVSATSVKVRVYALNDLAGNVWAAYDAGFSIALHAAPYVSADTPLTQIDRLARGNGLRVSTLNQLIQNQAQQRLHLLGAHKEDGSHNCLEVARAYGALTHNGSAYSLASQQAISGFANPSAGRLILSFSGGTLAAPVAVFPSEGYAPSSSGLTSDLWLCCPTKPATLTAAEVWSYKFDYSAKNWTRADPELAVSVHGGAV